MTTTICNSRLKNTGKMLLRKTLFKTNSLYVQEILLRLNLPSVRSSNSILPDLIFNDCTPSLAIVICEKFLQQEYRDIERIQQLQREFRNGFAIITGIEDPNMWLDVQCQIDFGNVRLFQAQSTEEIVSLINSIHSAMKNKTKFELQTQILEQEKSNLTDSGRIRELVKNLMSEMDIPPFEAEQIILHHKTFKNIVLNCRTFENPGTQQKFYSAESAEKLFALFSTFEDDDQSMSETTNFETRNDT